MTTFAAARPSSLDMALSYRILQLRVAVFVVEQNCAYAELDGRDLEPDTRWVWAEQQGEVVAGLRILADPAGAGSGGAGPGGSASGGPDVIRIGRVVTAAKARGTGLGRALMSYSLQLIGARRIVLDAQLPLLDWYRGFGFSRCGPDFVEDGITHVPMSRPAAGDGVDGANGTDEAGRSR